MICLALTSELASNRPHTMSSFCQLLLSTYKLWQPLPLVAQCAVRLGSLWQHANVGCASSANAVANVPPPLPPPTPHQHPPTPTH